MFSKKYSELEIYFKVEANFSQVIMDNLLQNLVFLPKIIYFKIFCRVQRGLCFQTSLFFQSRSTVSFLGIKMIFQPALSFANFNTLHYLIIGISFNKFSLKYK